LKISFNLFVTYKIVSELKATLIGCEYDKEIDEKPFELFAKLSKQFKINRMRMPENI